MRTALLATVLALPMLFAAPAPAADPVSDFPTLRAELGTRGDGKDIRRALSILDRRASTLGARLGIAARLANLLERAFPDEFLPGAAPPSLGAALDADLEPLNWEVTLEKGRLMMRSEWLSPRGLSRINRRFDGASQRMSFPTPMDPVTRSRNLHVDAMYLARCHAIADRDPGDGVVRKHMNCEFQIGEGGVDFVGLHPRMSFTESDQGIHLEGSWSVGLGTWSLDLTVRGVGERGVFYPAVGDVEGHVLYETPGRLPVRYDLLPTGYADHFTVRNFDRFHGVSGFFQFHAVDGEGNGLRLRGGYFAFSASEIAFLP
jgi:hypothetical protein